MKIIRNLLVSLFFIPVAAGAASGEFMAAAQLLAAAKNADGRIGMQLYLPSRTAIVLKMV